MGLGVDICDIYRAQRDVETAKAERNSAKDTRTLMKTVDEARRAQEVGHHLQHPACLG
jgi:hypothetical protein